METNAYAFRVFYGQDKNSFLRWIDFLFLTKDKNKCHKYIDDFIQKETEEDKKEDDDENIVNWQWKYHKIEELDIMKTGNSPAYNVVVL